jgi:transaldolase
VGCDGNVLEYSSLPCRQVNGACEEVLAEFAKAGIDVDGLAARLQDEGAKSFVKSWNELLAVIASKSDVVKKAG